MSPSPTSSPASGIDPARTPLLRDFCAQRLAIAPAPLTAGQISDPLGARRGRDYRLALTRLADAAAAELWREACSELGISPVDSGMALTWFGSMARREAGPTSDWDLTLIYEGGAGHLAEALAPLLWYSIWNTELHLDSSVRSATQCRLVASSNVTAAVGLLDVRLAAGDQAVLDGAESAILSDWRSAARRRFAELEADAAARAEKNGALRVLNEPNLKLARGGLRDVATLRALRSAWLAQVAEDSIDPAAQFLLDVRDALALVGGGNLPVLVRPYQEETAARLGYGSERELMQDIAEAGAQIEQVLDKTWQAARGALRKSEGKLLRAWRGNRTVALPEPLDTGVARTGSGANAEVVLRGRTDLDNPLAALRLARAAVREKLPISPVTLAWLEGAAVPATWDDNSRGILIDFLAGGEAEAVLRIWLALDRAGLPARWIAEWAQMRSRPQVAPIHRYTLDAHSVLCAAHVSHYYGQVDDNLVVAALLHDIGKIQSGPDHARIGSAIVMPVLGHLGVAGADANEIQWLIAQHLTLSEAIGKLDPTDSEAMRQLRATLRQGMDPALYDGPGEAQWRAKLVALTMADTAATGGTQNLNWKLASLQALVEGLDN